VNNRHLYFLVLGLALIGLILFLFKLFVMGFPLTPYTHVDVWNVEVRLVFDVEDRPVKVALFIPTTTHRFIVSDENFISRGYGLTTKTEDGNRQAVWSIRKAKGRQALYYRAVVRQISVKEPHLAPSKEPEIKAPDLEGPYLDAARSLFSQIHAQSADLETLVAVLIQRLNAKEPDQNAALLLGKNPSLMKKLQTAVSVLTLNKIPARIAHGILLEELQRQATQIHWLQVYRDDIWKSYHPLTGEKKIPEHFLLWWHGEEPLVKLRGGKNLHTTFSVSLNQEEAVRASLERARFLSPSIMEFSLFSLPIQTQNVYSVLLLLPLGAFLIVVLRNVVGIQTFGTFMPILIALAFRETQLLWGIFLFSMIIALGLATRFYLENLKLLLVPRLASVLIVVIILMAILSIITHKLGLIRGLSVALFPMVILTMTIERMCIVWEERGAAAAITQGIGSLTVASLAYLVMTNQYFGHLVFVFPELLLIVLAGILLLGRYSGYRLLELYRFKVFAKEKK